MPPPPPPPSRPHTAPTAASSSSISTTTNTNASLPTIFNTNTNTDHLPPTPSVTTTTATATTTDLYSLTPPSLTNPQTHHQNQYHQRTKPLPSGSSISTALLVSSCTKLFPILLVIWPIAINSSTSLATMTTTTTTTTTTPQSSPTSSFPSSSSFFSSSSSPSSSSSAFLLGSGSGSGSGSGYQNDGSSSSSFAAKATNYVSYIVIFNNIEALLILLECGYVYAVGLAVVGIWMRGLVEGWLLGLVGLSMGTTMSGVSGRGGGWFDVVRGFVGGGVL